VIFSAKRFVPDTTSETLYAMGGKTCSMYEPHIVKPSHKQPQHKNRNTGIYLQSTLLWHNPVWNDLQT